MSRAAPLLACTLASTLLGGCNWTFDGEAPAVPLVGSAPTTGQLPRLNRQPTQNGARIIFGDDGVPWVFFDERIETESGPKKGVRTIRLQAPETEETVVGEDVLTSGGAFYTLVRDPARPVELPLQTTLTIRTPGRPPGDVFELPGGVGLLGVGGNDQVFFWWPESPETTHFLIQWRNRSFSRQVPLLEGIDPQDPSRAAFFFTRDLQFLITRDGNGLVQKHATRRDDPPLDLGIRPPTMTVDHTRKSLVTCGADGVRQVPLDGSAETVLDPTPCDPMGGIGLNNDRAVYEVKGAVHAVPLDGSAPPVVLLSGELRLLVHGTDDQLLYSRDPATRYVHGAGDGWYGDWRFMNRGINVRFSRDRKKLRWLENAAKNSAIGDLLSADIATHAARPLARNVRTYDQLSDGRVLANSNRAFRGMQNRVIVIDEEANLARWVADQAADYTFIPGSTDLLIDVVSGATGLDIVRVPLPAK